MLRAIFRTATKICDSEKAAYSFLNMVGACVLHLYFAVAVQDALLLVSPLSFLTLAQAYVEASAARRGSGTTQTSMTFPIPLPSAEPVVPVVPPNQP